MEDKKMTIEQINKALAGKEMRKAIKVTYRNGETAEKDLYYYTIGKVVKERGVYEIYTTEGYEAWGYFQKDIETLARGEKLELRETGIFAKYTAIHWKFENHRQVATVVSAKYAK